MKEHNSFYRIYPPGPNRSKGIRSLQASFFVSFFLLFNFCFFERQEPGPCRTVFENSDALPKNVNALWVSG